MVEPVYYEDIDIGTQLPELVKKPSLRQLVKWAVVSRNLDEIHYDIEVAKQRGLPDIVVQGPLKAAFLTEVLSNWAGLRGNVKRFSCTYKGMDFRGVELRIGGVVSKKYVADGERLVDCELWIVNAKGEKNTIGSGTVVLPTKKDD